MTNRIIFFPLTQSAKSLRVTRDHTLSRTCPAHVYVDEGCTMPVNHPANNVFTRGCHWQTDSVHDSHHLHDHTVQASLLRKLRALITPQHARHSSAERDTVVALLLVMSVRPSVTSIILCLKRVNRPSTLSSTYRLLSVKLLHQVTGDVRQKCTIIVAVRKTE